MCVRVHACVSSRRGESLSFCEHLIVDKERMIYRWPSHIDSMFQRSRKMCLRAGVRACVRACVWSCLEDGTFLVPATKTILHMCSLVRLRAYVRVNLQPNMLELLNQYLVSSPSLIATVSCVW